MPLRIWLKRPLFISVRLMKPTWQCWFLRDQWPSSRRSSGNQQDPQLSEKAKPSRSDIKGAYSVRELDLSWAQNMKRLHTPPSALLSDLWACRWPPLMDASLAAYLILFHNQEVAFTDITDIPSKSWHFSFSPLDKVCGTAVSSVFSRHIRWCVSPDSEPRFPWRVCSLLFSIRIASHYILGILCCAVLLLNIGITVTLLSISCGWLRLICHIEIRWLICATQAPLQDYWPVNQSHLKVDKDTNWDTAVNSEWWWVMKSKAQACAHKPTPFPPVKGLQ